MAGLDRRYRSAGPSRPSACSLKRQSSNRLLAIDNRTLSMVSNQCFSEMAKLHSVSESLAFFSLENFVAIVV
jgi:hypothetical protein